MHILVNAVRLVCDVEGAKLAPDERRPHSSDQESGGNAAAPRDFVRFERVT
jgi:hypothetical protein